MGTPNLNITHIAAGQTQKEVTANAAFDALDAAVCSRLSVAVPDPADLVLSAAQALGNLVFNLTGVLTADRNVVVPTNRKLYLVQNSTTGGHNTTVKTPAGTGIALAADGHLHILYCDGTNVAAVYGP